MAQLNTTKGGGVDVCGSFARVADNITNIDYSVTTNSSSTTVAIGWSIASDSSVASGGLREYSVAILNATRNSTLTDPSNTIRFCILFDSNYQCLSCADPTRAPPNCTCLPSYYDSGLNACPLSNL